MQRRLLVVEDEKAISDFLLKSLKAENFSIDAAEDGEKGLQLARLNAYDLLILDNVLPKKTGPEICRELRKLNITTPILMLSIKCDVMTKVDILNQGADDYLAKPFSFEELVARIRALLRRPKQIEEEILKLDDLVVDTKKYKVERGSKDIYLTRKEFMLLEYLLRNQGFVLSRGMILEHVWDMNIDPFSNTIESHIVVLRKKVDTLGKTKLIHTVPGRGYKLSIDNKKSS